MAVHYGDQISSSFLALDTIPRYPAAWTGGSRVRTAVFTVTVPSGTALATDAIRMGTIRSGDRIGDLRLSAPAFTSTAPTVNVGLYLAGTAHDGAAVDADLFGTAVSLATAQDQTDLFTEATTLAGYDRWKFAWQLPNISTATSYTADPRVEYDITLTTANSPTTTAAAFEILLEVDFIAGS